jgi:hypothetical protein
MQVEGNAPSIISNMLHFYNPMIMDEYESRLPVQQGNTKIVHRQIKCEPEQTRLVAMPPTLL